MRVAGVAEAVTHNLIWSYDTMASAITVKSNASTTLVERKIREARELAETVEQILWDLECGEHPTAGRWQVLRSAGFESMGDLQSAHSRVLRVKHFMQLAGSRREYQDAERAALETGKAYGERAPELQEKIAILQAELDELAAARDAAARKRDNYAAARAQLRDPLILPAFVREAYDDAVAAIRQSARGARIREIAATITVIERLQEIDLGTPMGQRQAISHCDAMRMLESPSLFEAGALNICLARPMTSTPGPQHSLDGFDGYRKRRLEVERPQLEAELNELRSEQSAELARLESQLDYYVKRL